MSIDIQRLLTRASGNVFADVHWRSFIFEGRTVEVPTQWSDTACEIMCRQYLRKFETSARQLIFRVANSIRLAGQWQNYFANAEDAASFEAELTYILLHQLGSLNSPVWFNCGLFSSYGIAGQAQNFAWDKTAVPVTSAYIRPQVSACFIQSVQDDLISIFDLLKSEAKLFKFGSGSGTNFSNLRGRNEALEQGGTSSGLLSYLEVFDKAAQAIKSGGTTRRAAKMVCLDADHPEVEAFIQWKMFEERKARVLSGAGFGIGLDSEAYRSVSGQNSNNSIRLNDEFMNRVLNQQKWQLRDRVTGQVCGEVDAHQLFAQIARAAWECADPGLQFHDTINRWHTCPAGGAIHASNPCSEYMFLDDSACNLASLNLTQFYVDRKMDWNTFRHVARILFIAQDILIDYASYPTEKISTQSHNYRPLGLGYANLGALIMLQGVPYDSERGRQICTEVTAALHAVALDTSIALSEAFGSFPEFSKNREHLLRVVEMHAKAPLSGPDWIGQILKGAGARIKKSGIRNAQLTLLAPTGTIGLLMDCDTLGIEPDYSLVKRKTLAGGGELRLVNRSVGPALQNLGYSADQVKEIISYVETNNSIVKAPFVKQEHYAIFYGALEIPPLGHIRMMAAAQPFLSGAISKTVNCPATFTVVEVENLFLEAWKLGLKSIAIYRDTSKAAQPLCVDC